MAIVDAPALFARNDVTRSGLRDAAERRGLEVIDLDPVPESVADAARTSVAFRAPGGLMAQAMQRGTTVRLFGPTAEWFVSLGAEITGRPWRQVTRAGAKRRDMPARRCRDVGEVDAVVNAIGNPDHLALLATTGWLDIDSEYRVFSRGREVLTMSPYCVQDEPWSPLLHTHRASFHVQAATYVAEVLADLQDADVPPAAVLDVARLVDGRLVGLEANQCWGSGLYGCDPHAALDAVLSANAEHDDRWLWRPEPAAIAGDATSA